MVETRADLLDRADTATEAAAQARRERDEARDELARVRADLVAEVERVAGVVKDAALEERDKARAAATEEHRAAEQARAERDTAQRIADAEHQAAAKARAEVERLSDQLADGLTVLARWGANLDDGAPAEVLERALQDAVRRGATTGRAAVA